ncbi:MAG: CapA family protein [Deltaproteobacteria bacterium]|nr:CapA family protein [Deltaproteobacteria bacterium]
MRLFLCGDVMTGRGIDQVMPYSVDPVLHEPWVEDARRYVELAEEASGPIPRAVEPSYIWGDALAAMLAADARIANLETAVTARGEPWPSKGIHYRMHPANVACLSAARLDVCSLANNHVLDWGRTGLVDTLETLRAAGIRTAGAGRDADKAQAPAVVDLGSGSRLVVFALAHGSSGTLSSWAARAGQPGVDLLADLSDRTADRIMDRVRDARRVGDAVVASIHWGSNWGYEIPPDHVRFAHALIDGGVDIVHGHSSHHPRPIEVHRGKLVLYGCGDFIDDYEGITGYEEFRGDLALAYLVTLAPATGQLASLRLAPYRLRRFRLERASTADATWLAGTLDAVSRELGSRVELTSGGDLALRWS